VNILATVLLPRGLESSAGFKTLTHHCHSGVPMRKTIIAIAAGLFLTGLSLSPASGATVVAQSRAPMASTQASSDSHCSPYPGSVYTSTSLNLFRHRIQRGGHTRAVVHVRAPGGHARGTVSLRISGPTDRTLVRTLRDGRASFGVGKLRPGRYTLKAHYTPKRCSRWNSSSSGREHLRVMRHHHHHH
jgi:hypothetical protein